MTLGCASRSSLGTPSSLFTRPEFAVVSLAPVAVSHHRSSGVSPSKPSSSTPSTSNSADVDTDVVERNTRLMTVIGGGKGAKRLMELLCASDVDEARIMAAALLKEVVMVFGNQSSSAPPTGVFAAGINASSFPNALPNVPVGVLRPFQFAALLDDGLPLSALAFKHTVHAAHTKAVRLVFPTGVPQGVVLEVGGHVCVAGMTQPGAEVVVKEWKGDCLTYKVSGVRRERCCCARGCRQSPLKSCNTASHCGLSYLAYSCVVWLCACVCSHWSRCNVLPARRSSCTSPSTSSARSSPPFASQTVCSHQGL